MRSYDPLLRLPARRRASLLALAVAGGVPAAALVGLMVAGGEGRDLLALAVYVVGALACGARAMWIPRERLAWGLVTFGAVAWTVAWTDFAVTGGPPDVETVGFADVWWAAAYPGWFVAIWLVTRERVGRRGIAAWLDGLVGAIAAAALTAATVVQALVEAGHATTALVFVFPLLDTLLIGMLATSLAGAHWRPSRSGALLGFGLVLLVTGDSLHAIAVAQHEWRPGLGYEQLWAFGVLALGAGAWSPSQRPPARNTEIPLNLVFPISFALAALGVLVWSAAADLNAAAVVLSAAALALVLVRLVVTLRETAALADSRRLSLTDEVTAGANRRALLGAARAAVEQSEPFALLMLDLDRFKELNDSLGHQAGDHALRVVARRLRALLGTRDAVGRLGGDEFGIVLRGAGLARAERIAAGIRTALAKPIDLDGLTVSVSASVGIALHPDHGPDVSSLLRRADVAMYEAKHAKASHRVYAASADQHSRDRLELASELEPALERGELYLCYQPVASFATAEVTSAEALVRWRHPTRGELAPGTFLPAVEQTPLMRRLTRYVLDRALADAAGWPAPRGVAVNVTPEDVLDPGFAADVAARLAAHGLAPSRLTLEVTETAVLADPARAGETLAELRDLGVRVALDDFGTGYSSLTHLLRVAVDVVKIDRSFVGALAMDPAARAIVRSTVVLAHELGASVVAEGVEDAEQLGLVRAEGCDAVQGYALSRPACLGDLDARCAAIPLLLRPLARTLRRPGAPALEPVA